MIGAIIGDIVGSVYEWNNIKTKEFELFQDKSKFTDDTVMTIAVAKAILDSNKNIKKLDEVLAPTLQEIGHLYPNSGYGGSFFSWIYSENPEPYNSYGNGAAMRVSACGFVADSVDEAIQLSKSVTKITHNHPEGIKGAEATTVAIYLARQGKSKEEIKEYIVDNYYDLDFSLDEIRSTYDFDVSCQGTVPQAMVAFLESTSFEDAIRNAISIGGDSDTLAAITGSIAEAYYGVPTPLIDEAVNYLDNRLLSILKEFNSKYMNYKLPDIQSKPIKNNNTRKEIKDIMTKNGTYTQEEVNNTLWRACDTFRGKIDSAIYKDYVLVMLFIKYISDIYKEHREALLIKYSNNLERVERQMKNERFVLNDNATFDYLYDKRNQPNIGEIINMALANIEEENKVKLRGVFKNIDFNSESILGGTKERNAMLKILLEDFSVLDLSPSRLIGEDVIGNAYEYMISNFASDAGKKGGEFFTPSEVSELLARLVKPEENDRIYDPTCGSGSLLIKAYNKIPSGKAQIYGQERNGQTHSLCRMNMFLHNIDDAKIAWGDTLANPLHLENDKLMKFQVVVANPPFSLDKWAMGFAGEGDDRTFKMDESLDPYNRFSWGIPPTSKGDYAFVLHMLHSLAEGGRMAVVLPHGVLFRGSSEGKIRKQIVDMNLLDAVIGLPSNLFFGTGIPACIMVFKQNRNKDDVLFIDSSGDGFYEKGKNQNNLREEDIQRIVDVYENYENIDKFAYVATKKEIQDNDYNLNIPRYVDTFEEEEMIDMEEVAENIESIKADINEVEGQMKKYLEELGL